MPKYLHLYPINVWKITDNDSIFSNGKSPYQFNVNHPAVLRRYKEYRREICEETFPLSDVQRMEFEARILSGAYPELTEYLRGERNVYVS